MERDIHLFVIVGCKETLISSFLLWTKLSDDITPASANPSLVFLSTYFLPVLLLRQFAQC